MEKIVLFGAGKVGQRALEYYGDDNVIYFADNNAGRIGEIFCGKEIISFDTMCRMMRERKYHVVIATIYADEIISQMIKNNVQDFSVYNDSGFKSDIVHSVSYYNLKKYRSILIYGAVSEIQKAIRELMLGGVEYSSISGIIPIGDCEYVEELDMPVYDLAHIPENADCLLIARMRESRQIALDLFYKTKVKVINPYKRRKFYNTNKLLLNNYSRDGAEATSESEWNQVHQGLPVINSIDNYVNAVREDLYLPLFNQIEIETLNRCNGVCSFCPVNKNRDPREFKKMDKQLFEKIIMQLADMDYCGRITLFSNNEPLLDDRIIEFNKFAKEKLPNAKQHLYTNGTLFNLEMFKELIQYLDELIIDNYHQELKVIKPVQEILQYCENSPELISKVTVVLRKPFEILSTRGGKAPNRQEMQRYDGHKCVLPFQQMIVRPDGKVSLCCNDATGQMTLGDLENESIKDVWYGTKFGEVRRKIAKGRENLELCKYCDDFHFAD